MKYLVTICILMPIMWIDLLIIPTKSAESCHGAVAQHKNEFIVDAENNTWQIHQNGKFYKFNGDKCKSEITKLVYWNHIVYRLLGSADWQKWINDDWKRETYHPLKRKLKSLKGCESPLESEKTTTTKSTTTAFKIVPATTSPLTTAKPPATTSPLTTTSPPTTAKPPTTTSPLTTSHVSTIEQSLTTMNTPSGSRSVNESSLNYFLPENCNNSKYIGDYCNISTNPCDINPCQNMGNCTIHPQFPHVSQCKCLPDFTGTLCERNIRPCKLNICLYQGICIELNETSFKCNCTEGHTGIHCEHTINFCENVTCLNKGVCRSIFLNYKCECLYGTSGKHCENTEFSIVLRQNIAKSLAYIAIIAISIVITFILSLDILKYVFGIDVTQKEREEIRREIISKKKCIRKTNKKMFHPKQRMNKIIPLRQFP
ncbi:unnamed protein product [Adineta ricciae]|uniref:EGF-like domain-containing protein n=1 Tax=Adineta ricciae TaxID=249248 RepID=A0A814XM31_ADIRI|nr:unnamed protein product [Adineta ricciae]CAF1216026.1 unnamed protein product [Adineta ricciae]